MMRVVKSRFGWAIYLPLVVGVMPAVDLLVFATKTPAQIANQGENNNIIYVNPNTGDDKAGEGSEREPFKTLTQALMVAKPKSQIFLAPGTYSKATGENFPIIIDTDVTVTGTPAGQGNNVVIKGSGVFISPTGAGQNVTMAIEKAGNLTGVTVINSDPRGYGLWIESGNPLVDSNTFRGNGNAGISINGNSAPKIINNYFFNNGGNGLVAYGKSNAQIDNNLFEKTGFGVSLTQNSIAILTNNRLNNNRVGIILEGNAQATLRNNVVETSRENGLVAVGQSQPDLGTKTQPGGNIFRGNQGVDVKNLNNARAIIAYGNQLGKYEGKVNFDRAIIPATPNGEIKQQPRQSFSNNSVSNRIIPVPPVATLPPPPSAPKIIETPEQPNPKPQPVETLEQANSQPQPLTNNGGVAYQGRVLEPLTPRQPASSPSSPTPVEPSNTANNAIEIPVIPAPDPPAQKPSSYRIVAPVSSSKQATRVRGLYPEAFNVVYNGKPMLQVGVFNSWDKANRTIINLKRIGVNGIVAD